MPIGQPAAGAGGEHVAEDENVRAAGASLVLGGGVGLGAFQAGAFEVLAGAGVDIRSVSGASIGAINGAIIAGNAPEERVGKLRQFWDTISIEAAPAAWLDPWGLADSGTLRRRRNWLNVFATALGGSPGLFGPRALLGGRGEGRSLYDNNIAAATLRAVIDFERLNAGPVRYCAACTDVERGEAVFFDTARGDVIGPEHVVASSSLLPAFEPVRIGDRLLGDGGLCCNLPLEAEIGPDRPGTPEPWCFALDLFSPEGGQPVPLNRVIERSLDLVFGMQSHMRLAGLQREWALRGELAEAQGRNDAAGVDLMYLSYRSLTTDPGFGKPFDLSPATLAERWQEGRGAAERALALRGGLASPAPGLRVHRVA